MLASSMATIAVAPENGCLKSGAKLLRPQAVAIGRPSSNVFGIASESFPGASLGRWAFLLLFSYELVRHTTGWKRTQELAVWR